MFAIWETPTNIRVPGKTNAKYKYIVYHPKVETVKYAPMTSVLRHYFPLSKARACNDAIPFFSP
jgi:hypothetical protein